jgi:hypothetical protein
MKALAKRAPTAAGEILVPGYVPALVSFMRRTVMIVPGARLDWADIYREFVTPDWYSPPSPKAVAAALAYLCECYQVRVEVVGGAVYCCDCAWAER